MGFKEFVKNRLTLRADSIYREKLNEKRISFDSWIRLVEGELERFDMSYNPEQKISDLQDLSYITHYDGMTVSIIPYANVGDGFVVKNIIEDIIVFVNGELTDRTIPLIVKCFKENPNVNVVYGDEDIARLDEEKAGQYGRSVYGSRQNPYFKPDWSPNAFINHFYFCNICAIRRVAFRDFEWSTGLSGARSIYHTLLNYIFSEQVRAIQCVKHIDEILVHASSYDNDEIVDEDWEELTRKVRIPSLKNGVSLENKAFLSVVIPSKDNPDMLRRCIESLKDACPGTIILEIIVVDNGSNIENKKIIDDLSLRLDFKYIYKPMEFNFAHMCNEGVRQSSGEFILLLNDDVTFIEPYTLETMLNEASYVFSGAVGAKLLYPESTKIQHAGVINNRIGPVHKLQFADDSLEFYHGFNKRVINTSAVTGALIMIKRNTYDLVGGMNEKFKVAFNDVDLCFRLLKAGYFNACCNNVALEHAESVSRGNDTKPEALKRLLREKKMLYEEHPSFKAYDPYYSKYLVSDCLDTRIVPAGEFEYETCVEEASDVYDFDLLKAREEPCVFLNVEEADKASEYTANKDDKGYIIEGFSFVTGSDNACYKKGILLKSDKNCFLIKYEGCLRNDVSINCEDQVNVELCGFLVKIGEGMLPPDTYRVGVLHTHSFAKEKIYSFSNREIRID